MLLTADRYMFHQANIRGTNQSTVQVGDQTGEFSLLQIWVEAITQEMGRLYAPLPLPLSLNSQLTRE